MDSSVSPADNYHTLCIGSYQDHYVNVLCAVCYCKLVVTILPFWRYFVDPEVDGNMLLRPNVWFLNNIEGYILLYNIENSIT